MKKYAPQLAELTGRFPCRVRAVQPERGQYFSITERPEFIQFAYNCRGPAQPRLNQLHSNEEQRFVHRCVLCLDKPSTNGTFTCYIVPSILHDLRAFLCCFLISNLVAVLRMVFRNYVWEVFKYFKVIVLGDGTWLLQFEVISGILDWVIQRTGNCIFIGEFVVPGR